jgi:hypothetical protein
LGQAVGRKGEKEKVTRETKKLKEEQEIGNAKRKVMVEGRGKRMEKMEREGGEKKKRLRKKEAERNGGRGKG